MRIAIIPARSGSKGLKDKNIIDLCGKPLIAYSIEAAKESGWFDKVIVSTDSLHYKQIAEQHGAEVMLRGEALSNDTATTYMVLEDMYNRLDDAGDYFMLLQPTSPMRTSQHVKEACEMFEERKKEVNFLVSMTEASHPSVLIREIDEDGTLKNFDIDYSTFRRQKYKEYTPNGAIYIAKWKSYFEQKHFFGAKSLAYIMNRDDSIDIDNEVDYIQANFMMSKRIELKENE